MVALIDALYCNSAIFSRWARKWEDTSGVTAVKTAAVVAARFGTGGEATNPLATGTTGETFRFGRKKAPHCVAAMRPDERME